MKAPRTTTIALLGRILRDDRRVGAVVLLVALVAAALLTALPRAVDSLGDAIVRARIAETTATVRDLTAKPTAYTLGPAPAPASTPTGLPAEWQGIDRKSVV